MVSSISPEQNYLFWIKHHWSRMLLKKQSETYFAESIASPYSKGEESGILREKNPQLICQLNSFVGKNRRTPCGNTWWYWIALFCSLWSNLSQWWAVLISAAELKANRFLRSKCMLKLKMELYGAACVNLMEVLLGIDSHLFKSLFLVFRTVRI